MTTQRRRFSQGDARVGRFREVHLGGGAHGSETREVARFNLGCGNDIRKGWTNADKIPLGPDVVQMDLMETPWPFKNQTFDQVLASHILEHVPHHHPSGKDGFFIVMDELHRVMKKGGVLEVRCPHYAHRETCETDPTHTRVIWPGVWGYFDPKNDIGAASYYTQSRFKLLRYAPTRYHTKGRNMRPKLRGLSITDHLRARTHLKSLATPYEMTYWLESV